MVRVGVDENLADELLAQFPREAQIVRLGRTIPEPMDVDFWILPFYRKDAQNAFSHLRGLKVAQSLMAGVDWILPWLPAGVTLCDGRGIHDISASEWVLAAILSMMKRIPVYRDLQAKHQWKGFASVTDGFLAEPGPARGQYTILAEDLSGKTVLIVGYGSIGAAIEARLTPFGVSVLRVARTARENPAVSAISQLDALIPHADIVVLIVPLTPETRGMFDERLLKKMKPGALLVNAARGPVVDTDALVRALEERSIRAAVDVTDPEPLPDNHPLWSAPNCLITPHIGGSTPDFIYRAFRFAAQQVRRYAAGEPLENVVTEAGY
ncbi:MAG TPA: 2-hydroxyacid dehydrogenase [Acidobacteriaceae bacterium]|jgi:phosphoglycerate dehydrogenase-like enzyme|nr:2-hydroxyacid dehydrogenase [Acidobacteriaceae bacterium]